MLYLGVKQTISYLEIEAMRQRNIIFKVLKGKKCWSTEERKNINQNCIFSENILQNERDKKLFSFKGKQKSHIASRLVLQDVMLRHCYGERKLYQGRNPDVRDRMKRTKKTNLCIKIID